MLRPCAALLAAALFVPATRAGDVPLVPSPEPKALQLPPPPQPTSWCYRARQKIVSTTGGPVAWLCERAPDDDNDGCFDWFQMEETVIWGGDYTLSDTCYEECECETPCFMPEDTEAFTAELRRTSKVSGRSPLSLRLEQVMSPEATVDAFGFPKEGNGHVVVWPDRPPGFVVRVAKEDGTSWDVKLFPMTVVVNTEGKGGDPDKSKVETLRLGFQIETLAQDDDPLFMTKLSSLKPVHDARHDVAIDGLYELKLGKDRFFVKMKDDPA